MLMGEFLEERSLANIRFGREEKISPVGSKSKNLTRRFSETAEPCRVGGGTRIMGFATAKHLPLHQTRVRVARHGFFFVVETCSGL